MAWPVRPRPVRRRHGAGPAGRDCSSQTVPLSAAHSILVSPSAQTRPAASRATAATRPRSAARVSGPSAAALRPARRGRVGQPDLADAPSAQPDSSAPGCPSTPSTVTSATGPGQVRRPGVTRATPPATGRISGWMRRPSSSASGGRPQAPSRASGSTANADAQQLRTAVTTSSGTHLGDRGERAGPAGVVPPAGWTSGRSPARRAGPPLREAPRPAPRPAGSPARPAAPRRAARRAPPPRPRPERGAALGGRHHPPRQHREPGGRGAASRAALAPAIRAAVVSAASATACRATRPSAAQLRSAWSLAGARPTGDPPAEAAAAPRRAHPASMISSDLYEDSSSCPSSVTSSISSRRTPNSCTFPCWVSSANTMPGLISSG